MELNHAFHSEKEGEQLADHTWCAGQTEIAQAWDGRYWFRRCKYPAAAGWLPSPRRVYEI